MIWDSGLREFPPRLAHQPFFYPVASADYARHIAANWNVNDEASGFSGFVTAFNVVEDYLSAPEPHVVGASTHVECWVPAGQLPSFNCAITDVNTIEAAFFGSRFVGYIPEAYGLQGKNAMEQFVCLAKAWAYGRMDFAGEVSVSRKAVWLNSWFWALHDFASPGIDSQQKRNVMDRLREAWELHRMTIPHRYSAECGWLSQMLTFSHLSSRSHRKAKGRHARRSMSRCSFLVEASGWAT